MLFLEKWRIYNENLQQEIIAKIYLMISSNRNQKYLLISIALVICDCFLIKKLINYLDNNKLPLLFRLKEKMTISMGL